MKKCFSLMLALAMILLSGISVFAAEDIAPGATTRNGVFVYDVEGTGDASSRLAYDNNTTVSIEAGEIVLAQGAQLIVPDTHLDPNTEYSFEVYYANKDITGFNVNSGNVSTSADFTRMSEYALNDPTATPTAATSATAKLRLRSGKGNSAVDSASLKTSGSGAAKVYRLVIETKDTYNTKQIETEYKFSVVGTTDTAVLNTNGTGAVSFKIGHKIMDDDEVDSYGEGDTVTISNEYPIWTKKQIERLVKENDYRAIELEHEDGSWFYEGRMNGMGDTNFFTTQEAIPAIINLEEDLYDIAGDSNVYERDYKFLILPAGVTFPTNGEMRIDVSDVSGTWDRMFTYLYRNGTLTRINTTYNAVDDVIVFRTNYLGAFVMTDREITNTNVLGQDPANSLPPETPAPAPAPTPTPAPGNQNPNTGLPAALNLSLGLGSLSLLTAGSMIVRRRKK